MERIPFCDNWLFSEKGKARQSLSVPHDAMLQQGRSADAPSGRSAAFFLGGRYEYEKKIWAPAEWEGKTVLLEFEGVSPSAMVHLNGRNIGGCTYGYSLFRVPLDGLRYNEYNDLLVEVDNSRQPNSRWYPGAGIYRPVWMLIAGKEHIEPDGIRVTTLSCSPAKICVEVAHTVAGATAEDVLVEIIHGGKKVAQGVGGKVQIAVPDAQLWSAESPSLYQCLVTLRQGGKVLDVQGCTFGIRKIEWSPKGLTVNGETVLLKGGCIHHDNGILGARSYAKSEWRRIRRLKEFGFNAVRSAHNPLCKSALDACDALGMYVMDEAWDMWNEVKSAHDYAEHFEADYAFDLRSMVDKDYNHPSVILYSIGNEVTEPAKAEGLRLGGEIVKTLKALDDTRPVTAGINPTLLFLATLENNPLAGGGAAPSTEKMDSTAYNKMVTEMGAKMTMAAASEGADKVSAPVFELLDIAGMNYAVSRYEGEAEQYPGRIVLGTETYAHDLAKTWKLVEKLPYVVGDFMWTAWDYLGEVGIGAWSYNPSDLGFEKGYPWLLADAGAFDILGNDNAEAGAASVIWGKRTTPYIGVSPVNHPGVVPVKAIWRGSNALPYWSYQGCDGNEADIEIYSTAHEIELLVNGKAIGREKLEDCLARFHTRYQAGELAAVAYNEDGSVHSESRLVSADEKTQIRILPEDQAVARGDIIYLDICLTGANGQIECNRDAALQISVTGGRLLAFGSANPKTEAGYLTAECTTYYGRCQAVVQAQAGQVIVRVSGEGMDSACAAVPVLE